MGLKAPSSKPRSHVRGLQRRTSKANTHTSQGELALAASWAEVSSGERCSSKCQHSEASWLVETGSVGGAPSREFVVAKVGIRSIGIIIPIKVRPEERPWREVALVLRLKLRREYVPRYEEVCCPVRSAIRRSYGHVMFETGEAAAWKGPKGNTARVAHASGSVALGVVDQPPPHRPAR